MSLSLHDLRFAHPGQPVLDGIALDLPAGGRLAIVGANGSGKSTLARCLAGMLPAEGVVTWQGRPLATMSRAERAGLVQLVGQRPDLHLSGRAATVRGEIAFGPENLALPRAEIAARVEAALDAMGLTGLADRDPRRLSGGETQRLVLAAALAMRPRLLVLDEPVTDLDLAAREGLAGRLAALGPGLTMIALDVTAAHWPGMDALRLEGGRLGPMASEPPDTPRPPAWEGGEALLSVQGLSFAYDRPLLSAVGFEVPRGAAVAVTGPNGAGKTTLMRLVAGLGRPAAGRILLAGLDTTTTPPRRLAAALGMVFQNADRQFTAATLLDEAAMAPRLHGLPDPRAAGLRALAAVGLDEMAGQHPFDLHNGARRLAAVAAAVAHGPRLLILDETQRGLDADHLARLERLILTHRQAGGAVLFVCHDEGFARRNATHRLAVAGGGAQLTRC